MKTLAMPFKENGSTLKPITPEELISKVDRDTLFMMGLIPYVIAEIAWDYADSCVNIAAIHKLSEYKTVCRRIRELRTVYERHHSQFTVNNQRAFETENMIKFQEDYADFFERLHSNIKHEITTNTQTTDKDRVMLEVCAYSCIVAIKAIIAVR